MAKYICAVEAADKLNKHFDIPLAELVDFMAEIPAVDAVPVVRCRECIFYRIYEFGCFFCRAAFGLVFPELDGYCSFGLLKGSKLASRSAEEIVHD